MSLLDKEGRNTSSNDPKMLDSRVFIGNLPSEKVSRQEIETMFAAYGTVLGVSLHKSYGFVQFDNEESAKKSAKAIHGTNLQGSTLDVNLAAERRKDRAPPKDDKDKDRSRHSRSSSDRHHSSSTSSSRRYDDDHRSSRHRDRDRDRDRDRSWRDRSYSPHRLSPAEMEYRARLRHMDRMRGMPLPPFRDPYYDHPMGPPPPFPPPFPRDPYMLPRDDPYYSPLPPPPPGRMRDPYGPPPPDPYDRMGPPPPMRREYDRPDPPPRPLTPPPPERRERELPPVMDRGSSMLDRERERDRDLRGSGSGFERGSGMGSGIGTGMGSGLSDRGSGFESRGLGLDRGSSFESRASRADKFPGTEKMTDMEIVVVNRQQKEYAEMIRGRVTNIGLVVDMIQLSPTVSLADALDAAANRGLLYALIVTSQHELHHSVTLTILHGRNPQEHKNMPLEDALGLVDRDFVRYNVGVREGRIPPRRPPPQKNDVSDLLSQAASGEQLSQNQLQQVIDALQKQKQGHNEPQRSLQMPAKEDIQRQQADLQAKILSLLGSSAVVPPSTAQGRGYDNGTVGGARGSTSGQYGSRGYGGGSDGGGGGRGYGQRGYSSGY